jgi:hypothetical protein
MNKYLEKLAAMHEAYDTMTGEKKYLTDKEYNRYVQHLSKGQGGRLAKHLTIGGLLGGAVGGGFGALIEGVPGAVAGAGIGGLLGGLSGGAMYQDKRYSEALKKAIKDKK